jgi:hypothetical protein
MWCCALSESGDAHSLGLTGCAFTSQAPFATHTMGPACPTILSRPFGPHYRFTLRCAWRSPTLNSCNPATDPSSAPPSSHGARSDPPVSDMRPRHAHVAGPAAGAPPPPLARRCHRAPSAPGAVDRPGPGQARPRAHGATAASACAKWTAHGRHAARARARPEVKMPGLGGACAARGGRARARGTAWVRGAWSACSLC